LTLNRPPLMVMMESGFTINEGAFRLANIKGAAGEYERGGTGHMGAAMEVPDPENATRRAMVREDH